MPRKSPHVFDFIVVGAGSAGCVLARRLADAGTVLLLEAGGDERHPQLARPAEYLKRFGSADDWNFASDRQPQLAGRVLRMPRGRGLGGSTRINASIWLEPTDSCLATLEREAGPPWSQENLHRALQAVRARVSPEPPRWLSPAASKFLEAARSGGYAPIVHPRMNRRGQRLTAADVWLADAPATLVRRTAAHVRCLTFPGDSGGEPHVAGAAGVVIETPQRTETLQARRDVVLCCGAVQSAALLLRSGIGPRQELRQAGVECRVDSPAVGEGLQDHLIMPVIFSVPPEARFPAPFSPRELSRWQAVGSGPVASNLAECGLIVGEAEEALQFHLTPTDYLRHPSPSAPAAMTIGVTVSRPRSRGRVWITAAGPMHPPCIDPSYLSDPHDGERMQDGIAIARRIAAAEPLRSWLGPERTPGSDKQSAAGLTRSIQRFSQTLYHLAGTCRMGRAADAVVDPELRVRGVSGLRVLDASILGGVPIANPNALIMALAWLGAEQMMRH